MSGQKTLPEQQQEMPGTTSDMKPVPDHGEESYRGSGRLAGKRAIITGGDSGIGRAVAIAFAREGADLLVSYLCEHDDAKETARWVEQAGRKCVLVAGDSRTPHNCRKIWRTQRPSSAASTSWQQRSAPSTLKEIEKQRRGMGADLQVNIHGMFYLTKAAVPT